MQVPLNTTPTDAQIKQCVQGVTFVLIVYRAAVYLNCSPSGVIAKEVQMVLDKLRA